MPLSAPEVKPNGFLSSLPFRWPDGWTIAALVVAGLVATPVIVVMASLFVPAGEVWRHLADTVLAGYVANTMMLMIGVGVGTLLIGVATAWLVTMCRFPGRALFEWALLRPLAVPTYDIAFTYCRLFPSPAPAPTPFLESPDASSSAAASSSN